MAKTIKNVAREAGVSISTVSRALNNSGYVSERTRKAIEQAMMGISNTCKQNNYWLLVDVNTQPYDFTTLFRNRSVDGLIFLGVDDDLSRLKELKQEHSQ